MYFYYFLTACGYRPRWAGFVTSIQILQMIIGMTITFVHYYILVGTNWTCSGSVPNLHFCKISFYIFKVFRIYEFWHLKFNLFSSNICVVQIVNFCTVSRFYDVSVVLLLVHEFCNPPVLSPAEELQSENGRNAAPKIRKEGGHRIELRGDKNGDGVNRFGGPDVLPRARQRRCPATQWPENIIVFGLNKQIGLIITILNSIQY